MNEPSNFVTEYLICPQDEYNNVGMCKCVRGNDDSIQIRFDSIPQTNKATPSHWTPIRFA